MNYFSQLLPIVPELTLLLGTCITLMVRLFAQETHAKVYLSAQVTAVATLTTLLWLINMHPVTYAFSNILTFDVLSVDCKILMVLGLMMIFVYGKSYIDRSLKAQGEYYVLALFALLGMFVTVSASHLLMLFLGLEILSLPLYALVALWRDNAECCEAALKYFITGAIATCFLLYGMSLLYGATGGFGYIEIKAYLASHALQADWLTIASIVFLVCGMAFKLGVVPFHMWVPDVYEGAPTPVMLMITTLPKLAVVVALLRLFAGTLVALNMLWSPLFLALAVLSIAIGNLYALTQQNLKRLLAYSSIAHMGFILLAIALHSTSGYGAALFYVLVYMLASAVMLGIMLSVTYKQSPISLIDNLHGLPYLTPTIGFFAVVSLFSMAGVPPILGFVAKMWVFDLLIQKAWIGVAVYAVLFTLLGAYYYIKVIRVLYFSADTKAHHRFIAGRTSHCVLWLNTLIIIAIGLSPNALFHLCQSLVSVF